MVEARPQRCRLLRCDTTRGRHQSRCRQAAALQQCNSSSKVYAGAVVTIRTDQNLGQSNLCSSLQASLLRLRLSVSFNTLSHPSPPRPIHHTLLADGATTPPTRHGVTNAAAIWLIGGGSGFDVDSSDERN